ncbi:hypothetical protein Dester_1521 [Desulfurobacterium thermolithotrophum DSM 11699]|uniref:DUF6884 domain-containing protein n=1 Tax=Desulfurobacterium thermolithotrophum (strain DSM 11699 / BSA) TaxID=868864 RepID=F0S2D3_DESTD|nr:DUF6884 domain-containing protein [Desulfurobacterium thermolithotrophum]ADY74148.1 hypothetical protein Dester_1521 [Desulfurobacterium thermolithotrophum DSM 11699]
MLRKRIALVTACGNKKEETPQKAWKLYKSARVRHLYRRSKELNLPFFIISAKYGLISADEVIEPYNAVMTDEKCEELKEKILSKLKDFDVIIYYRGGARKTYLDCISEVAKELGKELIVFGYGNMGDIGKLADILEEYGER